MGSESSLFERFFFRDLLRIETLVAGGKGLARSAERPISEEAEEQGKPAQAEERRAVNRGDEHPGRRAGKVVFVPLVLPGELVEARYVQETASYRSAELTAVREASPDRSSPPCPVYGRCGGCNLQHAEYQAQLRLKREILRETLERVGGLRTALQELREGIETIGGPQFGYRSRVQLHPSADGRLGYRVRGSDEVVAVEHCPIAADGVNAILADPARYLEGSQRLLVFAPPAGWHEGCGGSTGSIEASSAQDAPPEGTIWATEGAPEAGERSTAVLLHGRRFRVPLASFFQSNVPMLSALIENEIMPLAGRRAVDLYAGVGVFAAFLTQSFAEVVAVESDPGAREAAGDNLETTTARFEAMPVERWISRNRFRDDDVVVVDPPRTGLSKPVARALRHSPPQRLIYVSCDPAALARDLGRLAGPLRLERIRTYDFYPQTAEIETVVQLTRAEHGG